MLLCADDQNKPEDSAKSDLAWSDGGDLEPFQETAMLKPPGNTNCRNWSENRQEKATRIQRAAVCLHRMFSKKR